MRFDLIHPLVGLIANPLLAASVVAGCMSVNAKELPSSNTTIKCSKSSTEQSLSKKSRIKTFTFEYWKIAKKLLESSTISSSLKTKGFVVGDFHFNNLGVYFDENSQRHILVVNDFDDAEINYLIIDFIKYLSFIELEDKSAKLDKINKAYLAGLEGKLQPAPNEIAELLEADQKDSLKDYQKYHKNKLQEAEEFDFRNLNEKQKLRYTAMSENKDVRDMINPKLIFRINNSGSSVGMERYEFVAESAQNARKPRNAILEFKELKCSGAGSPIEQNLSTQFKKIAQFYEKNFPSSYMDSQEIDFIDGRFFLKRVKINNPLKNVNFDKLDKSDRQNYAEFYANYLGHIHSKSADKIYIKSIRDSFDELILLKNEIFNAFEKEVN